MTRCHPVLFDLCSPQCRLLLLEKAGKDCGNWIVRHLSKGCLIFGDIKRLVVVDERYWKFRKRDNLWKGDT